MILIYQEINKKLIRLSKKECTIKFYQTYAFKKRMFDLAFVLNSMCCLNQQKMGYMNLSDK